MYNNVGLKKILGFSSIWSTLGFYRGLQHYNYQYEKDIEKYNKKVIRYNEDIKKYPTIYTKQELLDTKPSKYYITNIAYGLWGGFLYLTPFVVSHLAK